MTMNRADEFEIFNWKGISILQRDDVFKVGTDALLLASWIPKLALEIKSILDVGTGSGILALLMARTFSNAKITGIDIQPDAIALAKQNIAQSNWPDWIQVFQTSLGDFAKNSVLKFDLIISNPPFFQHALLPGKEHLQKAKHNAQHPLEWMSDMISLLEDSGHVCIVLPEQSGFEWIREANHTGLYCQQRMEVYSFADDELPKRIVLKFGRKLTPLQVEQIVMYSDQHQLTPGYQEWLNR